MVCGTEIGEYAMIGAGAVVTRNIPKYALAYGNPAQVRGHVSRNGKKLDFSGRNIPVDSDGEKYVMNEDGDVECISK